MNFKVIITLHDYFTVCPNGGLFNYKKMQVCKLKPLSKECIFCNCDSRNEIIKLYRVLRQFIQNKVVKLPKKIQYAIAISDFSNDILVKYLDKSLKIFRVNNVISATKDRIRVKCENNQDFLFIGRLDKEKGVEMFCESVTKAGVRATVVGDGRMRNTLEKKYKNVNFVGWKEREEITQYMNKACALIFPSLWYETMGLTTLEALSMGIPVICGNNNASSEYIVDNKNGLIFEGNNVESLVQKIEEYLNKNIQEFSEYAFSNYKKENFSSKSYLKNILNVYNEIL